MNPMIVALAGQIAQSPVAQDFMRENAPARHYIVQTACAKMPPSVRAPYRRVAVLLVDADLEHVAMISERARGCHEVVATWEKRYAGKSERCAYRQALAEAREMADQLNKGNQP